MQFPLPLKPLSIALWLRCCCRCPPVCVRRICYSCFLLSSLLHFVCFLFSTWISYNFVASFIVAGLKASGEQAREMVRKLQGIAGTMNDSLGGSHALFPRLFASCSCAARKSMLQKASQLMKHAARIAFYAAATPTTLFTVL